MNHDVIINRLGTETTLFLLFDGHHLIGGLSSLNYEKSWYLSHTFYAFKMKMAIFYQI